MCLWALGGAELPLLEVKTSFSSSGDPSVTAPQSLVPSLLHSLIPNCRKQGCDWLCKALTTILGFFPHWAVRDQDPAQASDATATGQGFLAADTGSEALRGGRCPGRAREDRGPQALQLGRSPCECTAEVCPGQGAPGCIQACWQSPAECPVPAPPRPRPS